MSGTFWNINDLKEQHAVYQAIVDADPQNPARHFYLGMTMQMAGQHDMAKQHYITFCRECISHFGGIGKAVVHHENRLRQMRAEGKDPRDDRECYNTGEMVKHLKNYNEKVINPHVMTNRNCAVM